MEIFLPELKVLRSYFLYPIDGYATPAITNSWLAEMYIRQVTAQKCSAFVLYYMLANPRYFYVFELYFFGSCDGHTRR